MVAKRERLIAKNPISHGYLDGEGKAVEVAYEPGEVVDPELFTDEELETLRKVGSVWNKHEAAAAASGDET